MGETVDTLRSELSDLLKSIEKREESSSCVARHFGQVDHNVLDIEMIGLESMGSQLDEERCTRADDWIQQLQCREPHGMNDELR